MQAELVITSSGAIVVVDDEPVAAIQRVSDRARGAGFTLAAGPLRGRWFPTRRAALDAFVGRAA